MKKVFAFLLALTLALSLAACGGGSSGSGSGSGAGSGSGGASGDPVRVACILSGPISDMSWNYTAHQGMLRIEAMGAEIAYQENVENSALPDCINTYATDGYDIIILSTNSYEESALPITKDFPDTQFIIINGQSTEGNVTSYAIADEDQGFMQGAICALLSDSGKVGFVGSVEITPILNGRSGFEQGAKYVNPDIEVNATMVGSYTDVGAAKEMSKAMIGGGVDAIAPMCDAAALGVVEAAQEGGIYAAASGEGQETIAPDAVVCAVIKDTAVVYERAYQDYLDGKLDGTTGVLKLGAKDGVVFLGGWYAAAEGLDSGVKAQVEEVYNALASGEAAITLD